MSAWFDFKDGRYFSAIWVRHSNRGGDDNRGGDVMAGLWRDPGGPWHITVRFRWCVDNKAHDSADRREGNDYVAAEGTSEQEGLALVDKMIEALPFSGPVHKIILRSDRGKQNIDALARESFIHIREERRGGGA